MPRLTRRFMMIFLIASVAIAYAPRQAAALSNCGIACSCTISTGSLNIGSYNPIGGAATTAMGSLTVSCQLLSLLGVTVAVPYNVSLSKGLSGNYAARQMAGPSSTKLNYNLYSDPGFSTVWGDGTGISQSVSSTGIQVSILNAPVSQIQNIYAQIPANQNVPVGTYTDTITATLSF